MAVARRRGARWLAAHAAAAGALLVFLAGINLLVGGSPWVLWVVWGVSIPVAVHAGAVGGGLLGAHLALWAAVLAGLIAVDVWNAGTLWSHWVVWAAAAVLVPHALVARRGVDALSAHLVGTGIAVAELLAVGVVIGPVPDVVLGLARGAVLLLAAVLFHALLSQAGTRGYATAWVVHLLGAVLVVGLLALEAIAQGESWWWHVAVAWLVPLAVHAAVALHLVPGIDERWARAAVERRVAAGQDERAARHRVAVVRAVAVHALVSGTVVLTLVVVNATTSGFAPAWVVWPAWALLVLVIGHGAVAAALLGRAADAVGSGVTTG